MTKNVLLFSLLAIFIFILNGCDTPARDDEIIRQDSIEQDDVNKSTDNTNPIHNYFEQKTEFNYHLSLMEENTEIQDHLFSGQVNAIFYEQSIDYYMHSYCDTYHFKMQPTEEILKIYIPRACNASLTLETEVDYFLIYNADYYGYNIESLYIYQGDTLIFAGVTDTSADGIFKEYEKNLPFTVNQTALLTDHYRDATDCTDGIYNTEITFTATDGTMLTLHQGQIGQLGKYNISLPVAQKVYYNENCCDLFVQAFSYMLLREPDS